MFSSLECQNQSDKIYIYHPAKPAAQYYNWYGQFKLGDNIIYGSELLGHNPETPRQLIPVYGRVWMLFTELNWSIEDASKEVDFLINYMGSRGVLLQSL